MLAIDFQTVITGVEMTHVYPLLAASGEVVSLLQVDDFDIRVSKFPVFVELNSRRTASGNVL